MCPTVRQDIQKLLDLRTVSITYDKNPDDEVNVIVPQINAPKPIKVTYDSRNSSISPLVIHLPGLIPYSSDKDVPYKYNATMLENGKDVHIPSIPSVVNIVDVSRVTRSGQVFSSEPPKGVKGVSIGKHV